MGKVTHVSQPLACFLLAVLIAVRFKGVVVIRHDHVLTQGMGGDGVVLAATAGGASRSHLPGILVMSDQLRRMALVLERRQSLVVMIRVIYVELKE